MTAILVLLYVTGYLYAVPKVTRYMLKELGGSGDLEDFDRVFAGFLGIMASIFWPVLFVAALLGRFTANEMKS